MRPAFALTVVLLTLGLTGCTRPKPVSQVRQRI